MTNEPSDSTEARNVEQVSILGRYIKPEDLKHLMDFYKADHQLNQHERQLLSEDITTARNVSTLWGMFDCSIALFSPTLFKRFSEKRAGVAAPNNAKRPFFHRPILSALFATGVYFCSLYFHSKNHQQYRIAMLSAETQDAENEAEKESKQRMLNVWKSLHPAQLTLFSLYYYETAANPNLIMKNPMEMASTDPHAVQYFPPAEHSRNGTLAAVQEHERSAPHWEKLREANGFGQLKSSASSEEGAEETKSSAWDNLRKNS